MEILGVFSQCFLSVRVTSSSSCTVCAGGFLAPESLQRASTFSCSSSVVVVGDVWTLEVDEDGSTNLGHFAVELFRRLFLYRWVSCLLKVCCGINNYIIPDALTEGENRLITLGPADINHLSLWG